MAGWQLSRRRLVDRIEEGVRDGLVIVRGPAGCGKTLAVADWAAHADRAGVWVSLRDDTASRFALWEHVIRSVGGVRAADALAAIDGRSELHLHSALAELFEPEPQTIVLDDGQFIADSGVYDDIAWLVRSTRSSVVLLSRAVAPLESGGAAVRIGPMLIGADELAFTRDESAALLSARIRMPAELRDAVYEHLEGWPLATRAVELEFARRGPETSLEDAVGRVAETVMAEQPAMPASLADLTLLAFATRVVVAEWLTLDLAQALAPDADATTLLRELEREGLGSWSESSSGAVFRFQPFVRTALLTRSESHDPAEQRALRRAYARWADVAGHPVLAGRQAVALTDWAFLAHLSQRHFRRIMVLHRSEWSELMGAVPFDQLLRHPVLGAVLIQLLNADSGATDRMRGIATVLLTGLAPLREHGSTPDRIWRNASALAAERISGRYSAAATTAQRLATLVEALTPLEMDAVEGFLPILHVHLGTTRLYAGDLVGAVSHLDEALRLENDSQWAHLHARSLLALIAALRGELPLAARHADEVEALIRIPGWRGTYSAAGFHLARALIHIEAFDGTAARAELAQLERHYHTIEHWPLMTAVDALTSLVDGGAAAAAAALPARIRKRSRRSQTSAVMRDLLAATQADLLLAGGESGAAERALGHADHRDGVTVVLAAARTALARGDDARAISLTERLVGADGASPRTLASLLLVRAVARERSGRAGEALLALEQALDVLETHDLRVPLALVPRARLKSLAVSLPTGPSRRLRALLEETPALIPLASVSTSAARLTPREIAVLEQLTGDASVRQIADTLFVSPNTVKSQLRSLYRKLGVSTREEAVSVASASGLLRED
ncbi:LuxR C-terminal-related transcriptional regulator [Diaminobutyricimonas aerilata]|uniref:LuxR C-terminal-related transcriptional regulator n=1 Tax=Diaminobutyricimonas aerilata TaxID=1162967 RepID=UPI0012FD105C|nr:LuxR C-terminal-related transcriptional regulator [Diaminobutyricimonas aerilata]